MVIHAPTSTASSFVLDDCIEAMQMSDVNHDHLLNRYPEYVTYLDLLVPPDSTHSTYVERTRYAGFAALPMQLQENFRAFINANGQVNITEAFRYSDKATAITEELYEFCKNTKQSIAHVDGQRTFLRASREAFGAYYLEGRDAINDSAASMLAGREESLPNSLSVNKEARTSAGSLETHLLKQERGDVPASDGGPFLRFHGDGNEGKSSTSETMRVSKVITGSSTIEGGAQSSTSETMGVSKGIADANNVLTRDKDASMVSRKAAAPDRVRKDQLGHRHLSSLDGECTVFVKFSDLNDDGYLGHEDYVVLVNLLADRIMASYFAELQPPLPETFDELASMSGLDYYIMIAENTNVDRRHLNLFSHGPITDEEMNAQVVPAETICNQTRTAINDIVEANSNVEEISETLESPDTLLQEEAATNSTSHSENNTTSDQRQIDIPGIPLPGETPLPTNTTTSPQATSQPGGGAETTDQPTSLPTMGPGTATPTLPAPVPTTSPTQTLPPSLPPTTPQATTPIPTISPSSLAPVAVNTPEPEGTPQPVVTTSPTSSTPVMTPSPSSANITGAPTGTSTTLAPSGTNGTATPGTNGTAPQPTPAPNSTQAPAPVGPQVITGHNSWVMSNTIGMTAVDFLSGPEYLTIRRAYAALADDIVAEMAARRPARTMLRRRRLAVSLQSGSSFVSQIVDSVCPASANGENDNCVTLFGQVRLVVVNESSDSVYNEYVDLSQVAIEAGIFQEQIFNEDPGFLWVVEQASTPVDPSQGLPDPPPAEEDEDRGGTNLNLGLIVSGVIAILLFILVCLLVIWPAKRKNREMEHQKKEALEALREAEARDRAAAEKKAAKPPVKEVKSKKKQRVGPWPRHEHDERDNPYREQVAALIQNNCPDRMDELDPLLRQFRGREEELIAVLKDFKLDESVLEEDSEVDIEWDSDSLESSESSVAVASAPEETPVAEVEVAVVEDVVEPEVVTKQESDEEEWESEESSLEPEAVEPRPKEPLAEARSTEGLEPPDSREVEPIEPPGESSSDLLKEKEAETDEDSFESESSSEPIPEPEPEPIPELEPEPEPIPEPKPIPDAAKKVDDTELQSIDQTMESDWLSSSDESSEGYRIHWFKENGYWKYEKIWPEDFSEYSSEYDDTTSSEAGSAVFNSQKRFRWAKNGGKWEKVFIEHERSLLGNANDDSSESYISSDSDSDEGEAAKWVRRNGQWVQEVFGDESSLSYSVGSR